MNKEQILHEILQWQKASTGKQAFLVGLSGPQGCGKSTTTSEWVRELAEIGVSAVSLSIDDFYLTRSEQEALGKSRPNNPFLQQRGYPGTHDVGLMHSTLRQLKALPAGVTMLVPRYDKSLFGGLGDRADPKHWLGVTGPLDLIFLEGWMLGFKALGNFEPGTPQGEIDQRLRGYEIIDLLFDGFVHLVAQDENDIVNWRVEAEEKMRDLKGAGMSRDEARDYILKFLPAYRTYVPGLVASLPTRTGASSCRVTLRSDRSWE